jgi:hypothetical protein
VRRLLITGSQFWRRRDVIDRALMRAIDELATNDVVIISGACPTGADAMCEEWAERNRWPVERHPADWELLGKRAGMMRNGEMVKAGADLCVGFIRNRSPGATTTVLLAVRAGIAVRTYVDNDREG